jgi:hypothetical protein
MMLCLSFVVNEFDRLFNLLRFQGATARTSVRFQPLAGEVFPFLATPWASEFAVGFGCFGDPPSL